MLQEGSRLKKEKQQHNTVVFYTWLLLPRVHDKLKHTEQLLFILRGSTL